MTTISCSWCFTMKCQHSSIVLKSHLQILQLLSICILFCIIHHHFILKNYNQYGFSNGLILFIYVQIILTFAFSRPQCRLQTFCNYFNLIWDIPNVIGIVFVISFVRSLSGAGPLIDIFQATGAWITYYLLGILCRVIWCKQQSFASMNEEKLNFYF